MSTMDAKRNSRKLKAAMPQVKFADQAELEAGCSMTIKPVHVAKPTRKWKDQTEAPDISQVAQIQRKNSFSNNRRASLEVMARYESQPMLLISSEKDSVVPMIREAQKHMEKLQNRREVIKFDQRRVLIEFSCLSNTLEELYSKLKDRDAEISRLTETVKKFEIFLREVVPEASGMANANEPLDQDLPKRPDPRRKSSAGYLRVKEDELKEPLGSKQAGTTQELQLKIMQLERKVETLNFLVRQYRTNNKEEIKEFERQLSDYKPTIETELLKKLAEVNAESSSLKTRIATFQELCAKAGCETTMDWQKLCDYAEIQKRVLADKSTAIQELSQQLADAKTQLVLNEKAIAESAEISFKLKELQSVHRETNQSIIAKDRLIEELEAKLHEVSRQKEETEFKLEGYAQLNEKLSSKEKVLKKQAASIGKLEQQNDELKAQLSRATADLVAKICPDGELQQQLKGLYESVDTGAKRLLELFSELQDDRREQGSFMEHLLAKIRQGHSLMIEHFRRELGRTAMERAQWKEHFEEVSAQHNSAGELLLAYKKECGSVFQKWARCHSSRLSIEERSECGACLQWVLHWGQACSIFEEARTNIESWLNSPIFLLFIGE